MLSVVIPSHSRVDLLALCLRSVTSFAPPGTDVLVVDDGSEDGIVSRTATGFPGVQVVRLAQRSGFCVAANAGIAAARGDVIEMLNDDAEVTAGWADAAVRWFADPRIAAVAPLVLQNDPARGLPPLIDSAGDEYDCGGFARKRGHGELWASGGREPPGANLRKGNGDSGCEAFPYPPSHRGADAPRSPGPVWGASAAASLRKGNGDSGCDAFLDPPSHRGADAPRSPGPVWGASAAAAFYRRSAVLEAGGFPEHFGAYFEDVDLAFRLRRLGFAAWFDPASVVWHRVSASYGLTPSRRVLEQQSCNEERVFWRNVRGRDRARYFPRHVVVLAGKAARRVQEGTFTPWITGRVRAWACR